MRSHRLEAAQVLGMLAGAPGQAESSKAADAPASGLLALRQASATSDAGSSSLAELPPLPPFAPPPLLDDDSMGSPPGPSAGSGDYQYSPAGGAQGLVAQASMLASMLLPNQTASAPPPARGPPPEAVDADVECGVCE